MMTWMLLVRATVRGVSFLACALVTAVYAQTTAIQTTERLSDWLLRHPLNIEYPIALSWQVPQERASQMLLKRHLITSLERVSQADKSQTLPLLTWIQRQEVTGRVLLANVDPRWLQTHPDKDPVMEPGQQLVAKPRPQTVTVLLADGSFCQPLHVAGVTAGGYVAACKKSPEAATSPKAWIAQPDGRTSVYGIDVWNAQPQDELAPGAWIWAPSHQQSYFSDAFSDGLIRFLASLGIQSDGTSVTSASANTQYTISPSPVSAAGLRVMPLSASDWGEIGLLQTPTARMEQAGAMRVNLTKVLPYTRTNVIFQPLDGLEAGFRYTDIGNRAYDATGALQTGQTYKDKSFDFKLRLREEGTYAPAVALGVRDVGGTGFFSSEYIVANKRWLDIDASLGIGWGNMGSSGNIANPLGRLRSSFNTRPSTATVSGGEIGAKAFFHGPAALFGGLQWRASEKWVYKLEREGNSYQKEPDNNVLPVRSPWNLGATYHYSPNLNIAFGLERGNQWMLGLTFGAELDGLSAAKLLHPPAPKFQASRAEAGIVHADGLRSENELAQALFEQTGWTLIDQTEVASVWRLQVNAGEGAYRQERFERLNALIQARAPTSIKRWNVQFFSRGLLVDAAEVDRAAWEASQTQPVPLALRRAPMLGYAPRAADVSNLPQAAVPAAAQTQAVEPTYRRPSTFKTSLGPSYNQYLGGPDAFWLYSLGAELSAEYQVDSRTWVEGALNVRVIDNFHQFKYTAPSDLPRVRSYMREYVTSTRTTMPVLQATHVEPLGDHQFASVYGGYLESMFAGYGAEWLYRPWRSPVAVGVDVNHVYQRDFKQNFQLRDYQVTTGHATLYWETGFSGMLAKLQVGQYLAGDRGATFDVSKRFNNGVSLGVYATKTNVSAAQFGEGSFDKGIYLTLPFDAMLPKYTDRTATVIWQPLARDGGARLQRQAMLYNITSGRDPRAYEFAPSGHSSADTAVQSEMKPFAAPAALVQEATQMPATQALRESVVQSAKHVGTQLTHTDSATPWLWGAGAIAASLALDQKVDRWSLRHPQLSAPVKLGNSVPLLLGLAAVADWGDNGIGATALKSAGFAYAANAVVRLSFGRARPYEERGSEQFDAFHAQGLKSGFMSNHTVVAFALAAPFAQTYDMPWLYGAAGLTALARVQSRQHWLSDTVAGGVMGYAIGSVLTDEHRQTAGQAQSGRQLWVSPSGITAKWWWQ